MLHGATIGHMIRQSALQDEMFERLKFQQDRENQIKDMSLQSQLLAAGRPVDDAGTVTETGNLGSIAGPMRGVAESAMPTGEGQNFEFKRKSDASRTVRYKTAGGQQLTYELKTPEEQAQAHLQALLQEKGLTGDLANTQKLNLLRGENELNAIDLPGYGKVPGKAVPFYTAKENNERAARVAAENREAEATRAEDRRTFEAEQTRLKETGLNTRNAASNAARIAGRGTTGNGQGVQNRFDQRELTKAQNDLVKLQKEEQFNHKVRSQLGDIVNTTDNESEYTDPKTGKTVTMNNPRRSLMKAQFDEATANVKALADRQTQIRRKYGMGEFGPGGEKAGESDAYGKATAGNPPAAGQPAAPKKAASADVQAYAVQKGISVAAAIKEFKTSGYEVE
jgi:hypothetical protein